MLQLKIGVQTEGLRLPLRGALDAAARLGVAAVDLNARREVHPQQWSKTGVRQLRKLLADRRLSVCALSLPTRRGFAEPEEFERRIDFARAVLNLAYDLGCPVVSTQLGRLPADPASPEWQPLCEALADLGRHGHRTGAWLAARTGSEPGDRLAELIERLPEGSLGIDFDPGSLLVHGHAPEASLQRLCRYVVSLRAVDGVRDLARGEGIRVPLGRGSVDFPAILSRLEEAQFSGALVIEPPDDDEPQLRCAQAVDYLRSLFA